MEVMLGFTEQEVKALSERFQVVKREGRITSFEASRIRVAIMKAFVAVLGQERGASAGVRSLAEELTRQVVQNLLRRQPQGGTFHVEDIQDQAELVLMRAGEHEVARAYVLYREERARQRQGKGRPVLHMEVEGKHLPLDAAVLEKTLAHLGRGLDMDPALVAQEAIKNAYDGIKERDLVQALVLAAKSFIERDPDYSFLTARLLRCLLVSEALALPRIMGEENPEKEASLMQEGFAAFIKGGIEAGLLDERLRLFDLEQLSLAIRPERDENFTYLGLQTLYDRYFLHLRGRRIELPQWFFMRVAMGLALLEEEPERWAIAFYETLSNFDFMCSTPTLFNSGTVRPQLSSCYLTTVSDDLEGIYDAIKENALLSKYAGGLGNDWSRVRALGSLIRGTNGLSQGVVPFLKVVNDTAVAVNQGGKRRGAVCAYLEVWHLDIEEFLDLRKNTGDERRRTHDMNTAVWVPDLFMKRIEENGPWTLFSPSDVPHLHELWGRAFEEAYLEAEERARRKEIALSKTMEARDLWRKMLTMLFETGHPWITFKDACNIRSPQRHAGVVHSSNLCTEITLNTSDEEIAVCNLGSVNLARHLKEGGLDLEKLRATTSIAMRMLDNVIDINYYAVAKARRANLRHRPVGLGVMGFQDCLYILGLPYASQEAVEFADTSMEAVCYCAYLASSELASERGVYKSYRGSLWEKGVLPHETLALLEKERGGHVEVDTGLRLDWEALRAHILRHGMRNSNCVALAPTATIANIVGVFPAIDPTYRNLYVKSNLSGEFTVVNPYLAQALKAMGLWDEVMVADLKYFEGSVQEVPRIPEPLKAIFATAFEIDSEWLIEAAARRSKWIDQSQSLNLYFSGSSGAKLSEIYRLAWRRGIKTTYYLRTLAASAAEKSTVEKEPRPIAENVCAMPSADGECGGCQ